MTLSKLIEELTALYADGVPGETELIFFAERSLEGSKYPAAIQMDTLSVSINGDCVQLFMQGDK